MKREITQDENEIIDKIIKKELRGYRNKTITMRQFNRIQKRIIDSIIVQSIERDLFNY